LSVRIELNLDLQPTARPYNSLKKVVIMILELADIRIHPGQQAAFDEAIQRGLTSVISQAKGFRGFKVNKGIESPERYLLQIFWDTLEDHTVGFRQSPAFADWRAIVGPFFAAPPNVEHFDLLTKSA
jgi:heme-degrading monooxygenase HmoA